MSSDAYYTVYNLQILIIIIVWTALERTNQMCPVKASFLVGTKVFKINPESYSIFKKRKKKERKID